MKPRNDPRIDAYIANAAEFARPILRHLRALVHQGCPEAEETIKWGMPTFLHHGILCGMGAFKEHCAFWFRRQAMAAVIACAGTKAEEAMGSFGRITSLAGLPNDRALLRYIRQAAQLNASGFPARPVAKPETLVVPADLAVALRRNKAAAATFEEFSPAKRRDYVGWIAEAKREDTRRKRLATTLEWLAAGKARNWKYVKC